MGESRREAQLRTVAEATGHMDAERRSWPFCLQMTVANLAFGLAPLVPKSAAIFGVLTPWQGLACVLPGQVAMYICLWLYRRGGSESRAYRQAEAVETWLLYGSQLAIVFLSSVRWSPVWALCPFTAIFWGMTKPFSRWLYRGIIGSSHALMALAFLLRGDPFGAGLAVLFGAATFLVFERTAQPARNRLLAEVDRDLARGQISERHLEAERERIARALTAGIADRFELLVRRIGEGGAREKVAELGRHALDELRNIARSGSDAVLPPTLEALASLVTRKLEPLCVEAVYRQEISGAPDAVVNPSCALAALRIIQELARNAITHGAAKSVKVTLAHDGQTLEVTVRDDGPGLEDEKLRRATGGLNNAQRWASELGGSFLRLQRPGEGTALRVTLPAGGSDPLAPLPADPRR
jgi:signal transduction histidine kinase